MVPEPQIVAAPRSRVRVALGAVVVLVLVGLGAAVLSAVLSPQAPAVQVVGVGATPGGVDVSTPPLVVHVLGAVVSPGLYTVPAGSRVVDAVAAAGGFTDDADRGGVNLARLLVDAEQVLVPVVGAVETSTGVSGAGVVNLNTADSAALQTLPRVGPALAERIIAWRSANGGFRSVDDLLSVSGIGDKTFEGIRPLVTV